MNKKGNHEIKNKLKDTAIVLNKTLRSRANCYKLLDDYEHAREDCDTILNSNKNDFEALNLLSMIQFDMKRDFDSALANIKMAYDFCEKQLEKTTNTPFDRYALQIKLADISNN